MSEFVFKKYDLITPLDTFASIRYGADVLKRADVQMSCRTIDSRVFHFLV